MHNPSAFRVVALLGVLGLTGCAVVPEPAPLLAYPGPGKTAEAMQGDDAACQAEAGTAATRTPAPVTSAPAAGATQLPPADPASTLPRTSPEEAYLACMRGRGNVVAPAPPTRVAYPTYYAPYAYGVPYAYGAPYAYGGYAPFAPYYPFYGPYPFAFGLGVGFYGSRSYGYHHGYGFRGYYGPGRFGGARYGFHGGRRR